MTAIVIHPDSSPQYYSYYLAGFEEYFGSLQVRFSRNDLPSLLGPRDGLAVLLPNGRRIFIAADDHTHVNAEALAWCNVYGMVNPPPSSGSISRDARIVPIGPGFGVKWRSLSSACWYLVRARAAGGATFAGLPARLRAIVKHQRQRVPISEYTQRAADPGYLFFISSSWARHPGTVSPRVTFINVVRGVAGLNFEGGIVGASDPFLAARRPYTTTEYVSRTQRSVLAFNTPGVHDCLGWKLGEYLALGKAIVTLPISRELPQDLEHGVNVHFADESEESIQDAIEQVRFTPGYRESLESGARTYFDKWLAPRSVVARLAGTLHEDPRLVS